MKTKNKMKNIPSASIILLIFLIFGSLFVLYKYNELQCQYKKLDKLYKNRAADMVSNDVFYMNLYYIDSTLLEMNLYPKAVVYFKIIGENTHNIFTETNNICLNWNEEIKNKYIASLDEYIDNEDNETKKIITQGILITDKICKKGKE